MNRISISDQMVREILRRSDESEEPAAIAHALGLHRMEVVAVLAHRRMHPTKSHGDSVIHPSQKLSTTGAEHPPKVRTGVSTRPEPPLSVPSDESDARPPGIYVGDDAEFDTPATWDPVATTNPHLMIMGESGSGKTYATQGLIAELAHAGIPSIVFDYGQGFERETLEGPFIKYSNPREYRVGEEGLALNPLEISPGDARGPNQVATRLADVFDAGFQLGDIQKKVLIDATIEVYRQAGILPDQKKTWSKPVPNIRNLQEAIDTLAATKEYPNHKNAAGLAARLTTFFMLATFRDEQWSWDDLISDTSTRVHILQFRGLEGKTQRVLVEVLLWHLFFHLKSHGQKSLRLFLVLDEAHHLSFRESGPINALVREARKFGLGLIFASQQPEDFSAAAYSNSASKLIFQTADPTLKVSRFLAGKAENIERPEDVRDTIAGLERGTALLITRKRGLVVRIADFPTRSTQWQAE